ncbi:MAG TPA: GNAT family N-acetyltransferase [Vicinamibacteria bacterium]
MSVRAAHDGDWPPVWALFQSVAAAGDVFAYDDDTTEAVARKLWFEPPAAPFVADRGGRTVGTYYVRPNQPGRGAHVANAGYMVDVEARGQGIASALCEHSLETARRLGYRAMQFNFVVSTNVSALRVWEKHGFAVVGRLPGVFRHRTLGFVDALVLHRSV